MDSLHIGDVVTYVDEVGLEYNALVTEIWGPVDRMDTNPPCINLLYTSFDDEKTDKYGRQIERRTSIVHQMSQQAHGNYYKLK